MRVRVIGVIVKVIGVRVIVLVFILISQSEKNFDSDMNDVSTNTNDGYTTICLVDIIPFPKILSAILLG